MAPVKYATADTQILTTKGQILKVAVSGVSGLVSGVFVLGLPLSGPESDRVGRTEHSSGAAMIDIFRQKSEILVPLQILIHL